MGYLVAIAAVVGFLWLLAKFPKFRGAVVVAILIVAGLIWWHQRESDEKEKLAHTLIARSDIVFEDLQLRDRYGSHSLQGRIANNSKIHTLSSLTINIRAFDCPDAVSRTGCKTIGEDSVAVFLVVPPQQIRELSQAVYFSNMPAPKGSFQWNFDVTDIAAQIK